MLQERYPNNAKLMKCYGRFLEEVGLGVTGWLWSNRTYGCKLPCSFVYGIQ